MHSVPSSIQGAASLTSSSLDNSLAEMYRSPPRPLPYDADPRCSRLQRDGLVSRREKGSSHSHEESEPLRSDNDADSESFRTGDKWNASACEGGKEQHSRSSLKLSSAKATVGIGYVYSSSEEEDVCPTCLDGIILDLALIGAASIITFYDNYVSVDIVSLTFLEQFFFSFLASLLNKYFIHLLAQGNPPCILFTCLSFDISVLGGNSIHHLNSDIITL